MIKRYSRENEILIEVVIMKRLFEALFKAFSVVYIAVYLVLSGCIVSWITSGMNLIGGCEYLVHLDLGKIPEGTVFADVLAKGDWDRVEQAYWTYESTLGISGHDCEDAQYDMDGYKSLMFHTTFNYTGDKIDPAQSHNKVCFEYWRSYFEYLPYIKVAYCDKDGNILGFTEEKHIRPVFLRSVSYDLYADGDELSYKVVTEHPFKNSRLKILFLAMTVFGIIYKIRIRRKKKKLIQSGETDNERKE